MKPRFSFLVTILCAFFSVFATETASAAKKKEKIVGMTKVEGGGTFRINDQTVPSGTPVRCGDILETKESVQVTLNSGKVYIAEVTSRVRLVCRNDGTVTFLVIYGGVHTIDHLGGDTIDPLPYLAAFGFGNFSFPSIGGGNSSNGNVVSVVLPSGRIAFFDSAGNFVRFN